MTALHQPAFRHRRTHRGCRGGVTKRAPAFDPAAQLAPPDTAAPDGPIDEQARKMEGRIARRVARWFGFMIGSLSLRGLADAFLAGRNVDGIMEWGGLTNLGQAAAPVSEAIRDGYRDAGRSLTASFGEEAQRQARTGIPRTTIPPADLSRDYPQPEPSPRIGPEAPRAALPPPPPEIRPLTGGGGGPRPDVPAPVALPAPPAGGGGLPPPSPPVSVPPGPTLPVPRLQARFNELSPAAVEHLTTTTFGLIREVTEQTRAAIQEVVNLHYQAGVNPRQMVPGVRDVLASAEQRAASFARSVSEIVGLTEYQAKIVINFRQALTHVHLPDDDAHPMADRMPETRDPFSRALRDRRFDATVRNARTTGQPLTPDQIDKMVQRYRDRWLSYRAQTIARTESIRTSSYAALESWRQLVEQGVFDETTMRRYFIIARDERTCPVCSQIPKLNPHGVGLNEPFKVPAGVNDGIGQDVSELMNPPVHPNCRCAFVVRIGKANDYNTVAAGDAGF